MTERIPVLKESIEKLRTQLDSAMFKDETPTSIRTTVSASVLTPSGRVVSCSSAGVRPSLSDTGVKPLFCSAGVKPLSSSAGNVKVEVKNKLRDPGNICEKVYLSEGFERQLDDGLRDSLVSKGKNYFKIVGNTENRQVLKSDVEDSTSNTQKFKFGLDQCEKSRDRNRSRLGNQDIEYSSGKIQGQDSESSMRCDADKTSKKHFVNSINTLNVTKQSKYLSDKEQIKSNSFETSVLCFECGLGLCVCDKTCVAIREDNFEENRQAITLMHSISIFEDSRQSCTLVESQTADRSEEVIEKHESSDLEEFENKLKSVYLHPDCTKTDNKTLSSLNGSAGFLVNLDDNNMAGMIHQDTECLNSSQISASSGYQSKQSDTPQSIRIVSVLGIPDPGDVKHFGIGLLSCEQNMLEVRQDPYMPRREVDFPAVECNNDDDLTLCDYEMEDNVEPKYISETMSTLTPDPGTVTSFTKTTDQDSQGPKSLSDGYHERQNQFYNAKDIQTASESNDGKLLPKFCPLKDMSIIDEYGEFQEKDKTLIHEVSLSNQAIISRQKKCLKSFSAIKDMLADNDKTINISDTPLHVDVHHSVTTYTELPGYNTNDNIITIGCMPESLTSGHRKSHTFPNFDGNVVVVKETTGDQSTQSFKTDTMGHSSSTEKAAKKSPDKTTYLSATSVSEVGKDKQPSTSAGNARTKKLAMGHLIEPANVGCSMDVWERLRLKAEKKEKQESDLTQNRCYKRADQAFASVVMSNSNIGKQYDNNERLGLGSLHGDRSEASAKTVKKVRFIFQ